MEKRQRGSFLFIVAGLIQMDQRHQQLKGEIKTSELAQGPPVMVVPTVIETKSTTEMSDKMWEPIAK